MDKALKIQQSVSKIEAGHTELTATQIISLCTLCQVSVYQSVCGAIHPFSC